MEPHLAANVFEHPHNSVRVLHQNLTPMLQHMKLINNIQLLLPGVAASKGLNNIFECLLCEMLFHEMWGLVKSKQMHLGWVGVAAKQVTANEMQFLGIPGWKKGKKDAYHSSVDNNPQSGLNLADKTMIRVWEVGWGGIVSMQAGTPPPCISYAKVPN